MRKEIWKIIPETNMRYEVSNLGNIRRVKGFVYNQPNEKAIRKIGGKNLSQKTKKNGYMEVSLYIEPQICKMMYVHRAVVMAFVGAIPNGKAVNHINGLKSDNRLENLEVVSYSDNTKHAIATNLITFKPVFKGDSHGMAKLSEDAVLEIRKMYSEGVPPKELSEKFKTPKSTICKIIYRQTWKHI